MVRRLRPREIAKSQGVLANTISQHQTRAMGRLSRKFLQCRQAQPGTSTECSWASALLTSLLGDLPAAQDAEVQDHVLLCATCAGLQTELKDLRSRLRVVGLPLLLALRKSRPRFQLTAATGVPMEPILDSPALPAPDSSPVIGPDDSSQRSVRLLAVSAVMLILVGGIIGGVRFADQSGSGASNVRALPATAPASVPTTTAPLTALETRDVPSPGLSGIRSIATATAASVPVFESPTAQGPVVTLSNPSEAGLQQVFAVKTNQGAWLEVLLPGPPNGSIGWVRLADVSLVSNEFFIRIELGARRMTAWKGSAILHQEAVVVGSADEPSPVGLHYILGLFEAPLNDRRCPQSRIQWIFLLSARSNRNPPCWQVGILSSDDPALASQTRGSVRMTNEGLVKLANLIPLGTPVEIVP